jgi:hypothetical protein
VKNETCEASPIESTSADQFETPAATNVFESTAISSNYLCTLLSNLENEISMTQQHLDDENDKRHKYKVGPRRVKHLWLVTDFFSSF